MTAMSTPGHFTLQTQNLGCLPIVNFFLTRIGIADHLRTYLPPGDARLRLTPAAVVEQVVRNLVVGHRPLYALGEWAGAYDPGVLGLRAGDAEMLNDDRVGPALDKLFDADRASLITATVLGVIAHFDVATTQLHNDSTTAGVTGNYPDADGRARGGSLHGFGGGSLIEREIRTSMKTQGLAGIPLYPELRNCPAPSAPRILDIFNDVKRSTSTPATRACRPSSRNSHRYNSRSWTS
jgi:hypothetical protein